MKPFGPKRFLIGALASLFLLTGPAAGAEEKIPDPGSKEFPAYVMNRIDDQYRGRKSHGIFEMEVKTRHWTRRMTMESWSLGTDYSMVRILKPRKEKGTATLKAKNDLFIYLNKTGRTIKVASGMMGGSWMGSHFTNDDLVKHSRMADDFQIELSFRGEEKGVPVYRFDLTPNPDAPVVWGRITVTVRQSDLQPLRQLFYDEDGEKVRILEFFDHRERDGRMMPHRMVMRPLDGSGEYTRVSWERIDFNADVSKGFFSIQKLRSM
jgi:hypothetical protein